MGIAQIREATVADVPAIVRAWRLGGGEAGGPDPRIERYLVGEHHPQQALPERAMFVAEHGGALVGYIAGHLTRRFGCDGELQWIFVALRHRGSGVSADLLRRLVEWFREHDAARVCVDVDPANLIARRFYARHGAGELNKHWMVWDDIGSSMRV
ncbi:MAG TPA: GNAT family N-acetyltransferase [Longimicrobium sp.]|nr:GNAT family N-acetyltransferase [Longimicrobium sp.]